MLCRNDKKRLINRVAEGGLKLSKVPCAPPETHTRTFHASSMKKTRLRSYLTPRSAGSCHRSCTFPKICPQEATTGHYQRDGQALQQQLGLLSGAHGFLVIKVILSLF